MAPSICERAARSRSPTNSERLEHLAVAPYPGRNPFTASDGPVFARLLQRTGGGLEFVVATRFGLRRVETFGELLAALDVVGVPTDFPLANTPSWIVSGCVIQEALNFLIG